MKIYTKVGDKGSSSLIGGERVTKDHIRLEAYGTIDELNSALGLAQALMLDTNNKLTELKDTLTQLQHALFNLGSQLACNKPDLAQKLPPLSPDLIKHMEDMIDQMTQKLPELKNFIIPGGHPVSAALHVARTICRRAERTLVHLHAQHPVDPLYLQFINRLGDYLFVAARWANAQLGISDQLWQK